MKFLPYTNPLEIKTCSQFAKVYAAAIDRKCCGYQKGHVIFDNYTIKRSVKDITRKKRASKVIPSVGQKVTNNTPIKDYKRFLSSKETKNSLVLYLADHVIMQFINSYCNS